MRLRPLNVLVVFCQLGGSIAGGIPVTFITELIEMWMEVHTDSEFYCSPRHGETFGAGTSMATEMETL